jgi:hypothetical protein
MTAHILPLRHAPLVLWAILLGLSFPLSALAHVELDSPNGSEQLISGSTFAIEWHPAVGQHDTLHWELWYSTNSNGGPWTAIDEEIAVGNPAVGSPHFYDWAVPNLIDPSVWVRVRQENGVDSDYEDISASSFAIVAAALGDFDRSGTIDDGDYAEWRSTFGDAVAAGLGADGNSDGLIDAADYTVWRDAVEAGGGAAGIGSVSREAIVIPEPASAALAFTCLVWMTLAHRRTTPGRAGG